jgi:phosphonatase-like hydrolase
MIQLVVFDMAGTTVYDGDAVSLCLRAALTEHGVSATRDEVNAVMGLPKPVAIARLLAASSSGDVAAAEVKLVHEEFRRRMIAHYRGDPSVVPCDGAVETFDWLKRHDVKVALDTGFDRTIASAILERLGWADSPLIDATVTSDEVARGRPAPDMIERAMRLCGVVDHAAVGKVGDTPADLRQGTAAGCGLVVGVTSGSHSRAQLAAAPHTHLIDRLAELPPLLPQH